MYAVCQLFMLFNVFVEHFKAPKNPSIYCEAWPVHPACWVWLGAWKTEPVLVARCLYGQRVWRFIMLAWRHQYLNFSGAESILSYLIQISETLKPKFTQIQLSAALRCNQYPWPPHMFWSKKMRWFVNPTLNNTLKLWRNWFVLPKDFTL